MLISRYRYKNTTLYGILDPKTQQIQPLTDPFSGQAVPAGEPFPAADARLLAPCTPTKILAAAVNYASHAIKRAPSNKPELFLKPPSSVIGPQQAIVLPADAGTVEAEGELVVVIGKRARYVGHNEASDYILGYTCGVDVSAREWQRSDRQFWRAKGCDTFSPIGPAIACSIDPSECTLTTLVNGSMAQHTSTSELLFTAAELVAFASRHMTLYPGDLIFTGTPGKTPRIAAGDVVSVTISGIGTLTNPVADESINHTIDTEKA